MPDAVPYCPIVNLMILTPQDPMCEYLNVIAVMIIFPLVILHWTRYLTSVNGSLRDI